jgi:hypothetical protein
MIVLFLLAGVTVVVCSFLVLLSSRLRGTHPAARPQSVLSDEALAKVSYDDIDMLKAIPSSPTLDNYVVIGGSGYLGT